MKTGDIFLIIIFQYLSNFGVFYAFMNDTIDLSLRIKKNIHRSKLCFSQSHATRNISIFVKHQYEKI